MNIIKQTIFSAFLLIAAGTIVNAQQLPLYSEYMFNTLEINPAYAGFKNSIQLSTSYRKQFNGIKNSPQTAFASFDMPVGDTKLGVGVRIMDDRFSVTHTLGAQGSLSYNIETGDNSKLYMGLQVGMMSYKANLTDLVVTDPGDPVFQQNVNTLAANFGTGLFFSTDKLYLGLSAPNFARVGFRQNNIAASANDIKQALHVYLNGGYLVYLNDNFVVKPSFLVRGVKGIPLQYDVNANVFFREVVSVGMSYRSNSALVGLMNFKISSQFSAGYSYDYNTSRLNNFNRATHEIILRYQIPFWKDEPLPSYLF